MKLTVFSFGSKVKEAKVGDTVTLRRNRESKHSNYHVECFLNDELLGSCSENELMLLPGTNSTIDVDDLIDNEESATVTEVGSSVMTSNNRNCPAIVVSLDSSKNINSDGRIKYYCEFGGAHKTCPGKIPTITAIKNNETLFLEVSLNEEGLLIAKDKDVVCGIYLEREGAEVSTLSEISDLKEFIKKGCTVECKTMKLSSARSYIVELSVLKSDIEEKESGSIDELVKDSSNGNVEYEEIIKIITAYAKSNGFSTSQIKDIISSHRHDYPEHIKSRIPKKPKIMYIEQSDVLALKKAFVCIKNGYPILCRGPKGAGKNEFTITLAFLFQMPLYEFICNGNVDKYDMVGSNTLTAEEKDGVTKSTIKFQPEMLLEAMEYGGLYVADEINLADPGILGLLNPITDSRRCIEVPAYKKASADKGFCLVGTMNLDYHGTQEMNEALQDRFFHIVFDSPKSILPILKMHYPNTSDRDLFTADNVYVSIKRLVLAGNISDACITIRGFIQAISFVEILGLKESLIAGVADKITDTEYRDIVIATIKKSL